MNLRSHLRSQQTGVTLPELLIVVTLIAVIGTFAAPSLNSLESLRVTTATTQLVAALRHAREESIRTGSIHSVQFTLAENRAQVLKISNFGFMNLNPPVIRHPISHQLYTLDLDDDPTTSPSEFRSVVLRFDTVGPRARVDFMPTGQPVYIDIFDQPHLMTTATIIVRTQSVQQTITLDRLTGRVSSS